MTVSYPGESEAYRTARKTLLQAELDLRAQIENVAALRRSLPAGGSVATDYVFHDLNGQSTVFSSLFQDKKPSLAVYSLMYGPGDAAACPMCCSMLDGLNGQALHISQRVGLVVVAAAKPEQLSQLATERGWANLQLLSAAGTTYQRDYFAETNDGGQLPMMNIFRRDGADIRHFWGSESFFADVKGQPRHIDQLWPLWNMFDLTPDGRGEDWYPALDYIQT